MIKSSLGKKRARGFPAGPVVSQCLNAVRLVRCAISEFNKHRGADQYGALKTLLAGAEHIAVSDPMRFEYTGAVMAAVMAGWILVAPTIDCAKRGLEKETPLSEWENVDHFNLAEDCESYRVTVVETEKNEPPSASSDRYSYSVCVRDDDPRLKAK